MSAPLPIKKLKQTTLSFDTTTQLDPLIQATVKTTQIKKTRTLSQTKRLHAPLSAAQMFVTSKDSLRFSQRIQAPSNGLVGGKAKKSSFFSKLVCNLSLDNPLYYKSSSILCVLSLLCEEGLKFG